MMTHRTINNRIIRIFAYFLLVCMISLTSCYYDNEEDLYPGDGQPCDTTNVTFSGTVFPVISANCTSCHSGAVPQGNISLVNYATISAQAKIDPGNAGSLYGAISHNPGNSPMPKNGNKLTDCTIMQIKKWIDEGTPNN